MTEKKYITEKDGVQNEWYDSARTQTLETLPAFLDHILNDYSHDQQTIVHAITAGSMGTISAMNNHPEGDLGQSQTSALLGMFIRKWARIEGPAKIMSWAGLLHPANEEQVMTVPKEVVGWLKDLADKALAEGKYQDENHRAHLAKLASGEMPWCLKSQ